MRKVILLTWMLMIVIGAQYMTWRQRESVNVGRETIAGTPVVRYKATAKAAGVVVVAHGFAGSKELMSPWGYALAQRGFDTYIVDEPGHGDNQAALPPWEGIEPNPLAVPLHQVIDALIQEGRAYPGYIALVGHSMGGAAVTAEAITDERVKATVAISSARTAPIPSDRPLNLLSLGANRDPASIQDAVRGVAAALDNGRGQLGTVTGQFREGSARLADLVTGRNHLTIIFDPIVMERTAAWIHSSFGTEIPNGFVYHPWLWILVALSGALGVVFACGAILAPRAESGGGASTGRSGFAIGRARTGFIAGAITLAVGAFTAVLGSAYVRAPWPKLAIVDYIVPYFLIMAIVMLALRFIWPADFGFPVGQGGSLGAGLLKGAGLFAVFAVAVGTIVHMNLSHFVPSVSRLLPLAAVAVGLWLYFVQEEALKRAVDTSTGTWAGLAVGILGKLVVIATWYGAAALPNPQRFLPLIMPIVALVLIGTELFSFILRRWRYTPIAIATFVSLVIAWSLAATMPLVM